MKLNLKIFITLFFAVFVATVGVGLVAPLLPVYAHELGAGAFQIGLIFAAFSLTRSLFVPYFGRLSDHRGRKRFLGAGLFLYFVLSLLYVYLKDVNVLILLRLGQGFASAMIFPVAQSYVGILTPMGKEGRIMGLFNMSLYGGLSVGPLLGGILKDWFSIQASFLSMSSLTLIGFLLCLLFLPKESIPRKGAVQDRKEPLGYRQLLMSPKVFPLFAFRTCLTTCSGITWTFIPFMASTMLGLSSTAIGMIVTINVLLSGLLQAPMGYIADRFSKKILVTSGGILAMLSIVYLMIASSFGELFLANGLLGLAGGVSFPAIMALGVIEGRRTEAMGSLMGLLAMGHSLGMLVGPLLAGLCIDLFSIETIFVLGALIAGVGTFVYLRQS
ncbi:MAG: MFS transporter [Desulfatiglans sp.]|jgi:MFS family permease|nr:MFS transporter [Thermodesulfobacteriota bacterium]MEE4351582.1 MFS transporter [Desulfatiglans sp.]